MVAYTAARTDAWCRDICTHKVFDHQAANDDGYTASRGHLNTAIKNAMADLHRVAPAFASFGFRWLRLGGNNARLDFANIDVRLPNARSIIPEPLWEVVPEPL